MEVPAVDANIGYRLLDSYGFYMNYEEVVKSVGSFACGVIVPKDSDMPIGTKVTVELRLYITNDKTGSTAGETGDYITIDTYEWTYEG